MADSFNKKERDKKRKKRKKDKAERKQQKKLDGVKSEEFMYVDENGNLTPTPPDPTKKKVFSVEEIQISVPKKSELDEDDKIKSGHVKFYNTEKYFGFIREALTNEDYFVHADNLIDPIKENDKVEFELGTGPRGYIAINVKLKKDPKKEAPVAKEETTTEDPENKNTENENTDSESSENKEETTS